MAKKPNQPTKGPKDQKSVDEADFDTLPFDVDEPDDGDASNTDPLISGTADPAARGAMTVEKQPVDFLEFPVPAERAFLAFRKARSILPPLVRNAELEPDDSTGYTTEQIVAGYPNIDSQKVADEFRRRQRAARTQKQRLAK